MHTLLLTLAMLTGAAPAAPKTVRLYVLDCGMLNIDPAGVERYHVTQKEVVESRMPVPCFLVVHPKGTLLWDVGVIPDADVEKAAPKPALYDVNPVSHAVVSKTLKSQLAALGYAPADITYVAVSHAHKDHTANLNEFASSTWLVRPIEREFMFKPGNERVEPKFYGQLEHAKSISMDKDEFDVFGDGTVVIKAAPGHTPGTRSARADAREDRTGDGGRRPLSLQPGASVQAPSARQRVQRRAVSRVACND